MKCWNTAGPHCHTLPRQGQPVRIQDAQPLPYCGVITDTEVHLAALVMGSDVGIVRIRLEDYRRTKPDPSNARDNRVAGVIGASVEAHRSGRRLRSTAPRPSRIATSGAAASTAAPTEWVARTS